MGCFYYITYSYFSSKNPLVTTTLLKIMDQGIEINVLDRKNTSLFQVKPSEKSFVKAADMSSNLVNTMTAMHELLNKQEGCVSTQDITPAQSKKPKKFKDTIKIKGSNTFCSYDYISIIDKRFIKANAKKEIKKDYFTKLQDYFTKKWLVKNYKKDNFVEFYFNYLYYGNNIMGIKDAMFKYFKIANPKNVNLSQAVALVLEIYNNNPSIYPNDDKNIINSKAIVNQMVESGYITKKDAAAYKEISLDSTVGSNSYSLYSGDMVSSGLSLITTNNLIKIKTTFSQSLQQDLSETLGSYAERNNIPVFGALVLNKGDIIASFVGNAKKGNRYYFDKYPDVKISNILKPFIYMAILSGNSSKVAPTLFNPTVRQALNEQVLNPEGVSKILLQLTGEDDKLLDSEALIKREDKLFEINRQIADLENKMFTLLPLDDYRALFAKLNMKYSDFNYDNNAFNMTISLNDLANSYAVMVQNATYYKNNVVVSVNDKTVYAPDSSGIRVDTDNIDKVLKGIAIQGQAGDTPYYVVYDKDVAVVLIKDYAAVIYLGDGTLNDKNNYLAIKGIVNSVANYVYKFSISDQEKKAKL